MSDKPPMKTTGRRPLETTEELRTMRIPVVTQSPDQEQRNAQGFWSLAWRRFRRDRLGMTGFMIVALLFLLSLVDGQLATERPLVLRHAVDGQAAGLYFPALWDTSVPAGVDLRKLRDTAVKARAGRLVTVEELQQAGQTPLAGFSWALLPLVPYSPTEQDLWNRLKPPSLAHPFGTDNLGRDVLSRMIHGASVSLKVGFVAMGIAVLVGILVGAPAGYYGDDGLRIRGWAIPVDLVISRLIEIVMTFPAFFLILAIIAFLPPSIYNIMAVIGLTRWTSIARYTRGEFIRLKSQDFAVAARALGATDRRIIFRHILPNSLAPILVSVSFGIASAILVEAALSFLGFGVPPPTPTWGNILSLAKQYIETAWWLATFPGIAIFLSVLAYNLVGEGLRDATDPRLHTGG